MNKIMKRFKAFDATKKRKLVAWFLFTVMISSTYLIVTGVSLHRDKVAEEMYWQEGLKDNEENLAAIQTLNQDATIITAGTYVETIKEINIRDNIFRVVMNCWFRFDDNGEDINMLENFRVYNGVINKMDVLEDINEDGIRYQAARIDVSVSKNFWTPRFPLESYQLRIFIESLYSADKVNFIADEEYSGIYPSLEQAGTANFNFERSAVSVYSVKYDNTRNDPEAGTPYNQELVTHIEINREGIGLYLKCFIALFGTITWVFIALYICTFHRVDPLSLVPGALFGTVTNIMVGANLLPDSLQLGLLEYVNLAGVAIVLLVALTIISINRTRNKHQDNDFAAFFGRMMFYTLLFFTLVGTISFPLAAYKF